MESTFTPHLRTNYVPSKSEVEQIREHLSKPLEEHTRLKEKIVRFQAILDDLHEQRNKLDVHIQDHLALISGARRLPHDVVREIFCCCLPTDRNAVMSATEPPLLLGRICSDWRKIALSTPNLWASLHIHVPHCREPAHYSKWGLIAEAVKHWLELSGSLPLSISAACPPFLGRQVDRQTSLGITYFLNVLTRHTHRWEHIDFTFPLPELVTAVALLTEADVPMLKSVILESTVFNDIISGDQWPPLISFLNTPTIREVSILSFKHTAYLRPLPWSQLTGLYLESGLGPWDNALSETAALNILKQCPMLVKCKLFIESDPVSPVPHPVAQGIMLPHLRSLILVEGTDDAMTPQFVNCLGFPGLTYLGFRRFSNSHVSHLPFALLNFFKRENKIEELELGLEAISPPDLMQCFKLAKNIKRLTLNAPERLWGYPANPALTDHTLDILSPSYGDDELHCPALEEITLRSCRELSDAKILSFLRERTDPANTADGMVILKRATFTINREMMTDIMPGSQPMIANGLNLDLKYIPPPLELDPEVTEVSDGPRLKVSYITWVPDQFFSPFRGLRKRTMNTLV
ncbi:hypothetical protein BDZ94DRAFT_1192144 [Collybia nuda]|uniref:F-box domain-containing protein n=1 Tax=Collybia nuda TaxID=64659 RepID=A0A9P5Y771_9AGAR|nr:hypothetical protein BDZ94DRAFT_1192144 [Collybia nuda]